MMHKFTYKKILSLFIIFLMLFSLNFSFSASSDPLNPNEGLWFDSFENENYFTKDKCDHIPLEDNIKLNKSQEPYPFDYSYYPDNIDLYYTASRITGILYQFISPNLNPGTSAEDSDMASIAKLGDGEVFLSEGNPLSPSIDVVSSPMHHFKLKIPHDPEDLTNLRLSWWFGEYFEDAELEKITMYFWDYQSLFPKWVDVANIEYKESIIEDEDDSADLQAVFNYDEFISDDAYLDVLIIGTPTDNEDGSILSSDYINLSITTKYGYVSQGSVTSEIIEPGNLGRWDKVIWEGSKPSTKSSITVQVLDKDGALIEGFESKKSPLDISEIDKNKIKIKAILKSNALDVTPTLDEWAVLYYKTDGFDDEFSNTYRIDDIKGLKSENKKIELNSYYSNWPIFGKNEDNSRSYDGVASESKPSDYYWYTGSNTVGGGFRAPIVDDGRVFIASADNQIYAFSEIVSNPGEKQNPIDSSAALYNVESSLASSKDHIIFGTNNLNSKNYIYGLNKSDLDQEKWNYSVSSGNIAFSSAPNIYDGKVFISSYSARTFDFPFLSLIDNYISKNNFLIALDQVNGAPMWDPFQLPAGSHSTPAIGDNKVFVACQNYWGSDLFALDIETGEEAWNISIGSPHGIIVKSSPVFADGKIFVMGNERDSIFSAGTNKIFAVSSDDGEILWNKSLGSHKVSILSLLKGIYSTAPISTPAYHNNTLFVMGTNSQFYALNPANGKEKWSFDFKNDSFFSQVYCTSPIVVNNLVYITCGNSIYCFNAKQASTVDYNWKYDIQRPTEYDIELIPPSVYASPVYADNLMFISSNENNTALNGRLYCFGNYQPNSKGYLESSKVVVPKGYWWGNFNANFTYNENNTIHFRILDEDSNIISGFNNLNGSNNNISGIDEKTIKLFAEFDIKNTENDTPILNSWSIDWVYERGKPVFNITNQDAWVNQDLPDFSVKIRDTDEDGVLSGIDNTSGRYRIQYVPIDESDPVTSDWMSARIDEPSGVENAVVTAEIGKSGLEVKELLNISFKAADLAGNYENTSWIPFQSDIQKPSSSIKNANSFDDEEFTDEFEIEVLASDTGGSGIEKVYLRYRYSNKSIGPWDDFVDYKSANSYFKWIFGRNESGDYLKSGYYQIVSIATDNATNMEQFIESKAVTILFDAQDPIINSKSNDIESREVPIITLNVSDDFKLNELYYRLDENPYWESIEDFNSDVFELTWTFPEEIWVDLEEEIEHIVYFRLTDKAGNEYITDILDTLKIMKDDNSSKAFIDLSDFSNLHLDEEFIISTKNIDDIDVSKVKLFYKYSKDKESWSEEWKQFGEDITQKPYEWNFNSPNGNGFYKLFMLIEDTEGLSYTSNKEIVNVAVFPMLETFLFIVLLFASIIISIVVIKKINKKKQNN